MQALILVIGVIIFIVAIVDFSVFFLDKGTEKLLYDSGVVNSNNNDDVSISEKMPDIGDDQATNSEVCGDTDTEFVEDGTVEQFNTSNAEQTFIPKESANNNYAEQLFGDMDSKADTFASDIDTDELASLLQEEVYKSVKAEMK